MASAETFSRNAYNIALKQDPNIRSMLSYIDFTLPSTEKRLWIIDMNLDKVLVNTWVAHGSNSGSGAKTISFSNNYGSHKTSLGVYKTTDETFNGHSGYSLRLKGLETNFNNNAYQRAILVHGASYIGNGQEGHSWGCFAVPLDQVQNVINTIKDNSVLVAYYPDPTWLKESKYAKSN